MAQMAGSFNLPRDRNNFWCGVYLLAYVSVKQARQAHSQKAIAEALKLLRQAVQQYGLKWEHPVELDIWSKRELEIIQDLAADLRRRAVE